MSNQGYVRGAHRVSELKYHFVWKTKYSYEVLRGEIALYVGDIIREICMEHGSTERECSAEVYSLNGL